MFERHLKKDTVGLPGLQRCPQGQHKFQMSPGGRYKSGELLLPHNGMMGGGKDEFPGQQIIPQLIIAHLFRYNLVGEKGAHANKGELALQGHNRAVP